jgi:hypothetical protein
MVMVFNTTLSEEYNLNTIRTPLVGKKLLPIWLGKMIFCNFLIMKRAFGEKNIFKNILDMFTFPAVLAVFVNKINNLATQSWKRILAFAS